MEIWKKIQDYPNYEISNLGNVKSLNYRNTKKEKLLKLCEDAYGYYAVVLVNNKNKKTIKVHKLVAIEFLNHIPNRYELIINHKNFIRTDNRVENLEIITARENTNRKHLKSTSKYTGVHWNDLVKKWIASINIKSKTIYLGSFEKEIDASNFYENAVNSINLKKEIILERKTFTSKYKGVSWNKCKNKWEVYKKINGKNKYLGCFNNETDAGIFYNNN